MSLFKYIMISKEGCVFCDYARQLFELHDIEYKEFKLGVGIDQWQIDEQFPGFKTFPKIAKQYYASGKLELIGGYTELRELLE